MLVERGVLRHDQLARVVAERFGLDFVDLSVYDLDMGAVNLIRVQAAKRYQAVPVGYTDDGAVLLAMANPTNVLTIDDVGMMTGRRIRPAAASVEDLNLLLARLARMDDSIEDIIDEDPEEQGERDVSVDEADSDAPDHQARALDRRPGRPAGRLRHPRQPRGGRHEGPFRVDGVLAPAATVKRRMAMGVVSRIKIMAELDISERRVPQDGRFALTLDGRRVDVRVVTLPLVNGEGAVMRILDQGAGVLVDGLEALGMQEQELDRFKRAIHRPNGAVLVTGPTGSGKSTTLYAALRALNDGERSILTIEDPVETRIAGIKQMQIAPKAGVTFGVGLRSMLRADPDVIMVGEIRDAETAHIAVEAAHDRPPRALHAAHARRAQRARAPDRHGHRAVPRLLRRRLHRRPAPRARALQALQARAEDLRGGARRTRARRRRALRAGRLLALRRLGLSRAPRAVRGHVRE